MITELPSSTAAIRGYPYSQSATTIARLLDCWLATQGRSRGEVLAGEPAFILSRDPEVTLVVSIAYLSPRLARQLSHDTFLIDGVPVLAVEILAPFSEYGEVTGKIIKCLEAGVALVWIVDPDLRTVTVHRPGDEPQLFNVRQELSGEPQLPGFRVPVAEIFGR